MGRRTGGACASTARFVICHAYDGYTTNLPLAEALKPDVLLVHSVDGRPLEVEHGGPCRVVTPQLRPGRAPSGSRDSSC